MHKKEKNESAAYKELAERIRRDKIRDQAGLNRLKNEISKKYGLKKIPTNTEILFNLPEKDVKRLKRILTTKPTRTISGVAVVAIMARPFPCPHKSSPCIYCPGGVNSAFGDVPQSYTGKEPATRRAIRNMYDPYLQVMNRLEQYIALNQDISKVELIIMGGTFPSFPKRYQDNFISYAFKAMNDFSMMFFNKNEFDFIKFKDFFDLPGDISDKGRTKRIHDKLLKIKDKEKAELKKEQLRNEKSMVKCVSLVIETRPDYASLKEGNEMLRLGCTKVELGVQTVYDDVLKKIRRGHTVEDSIKATKTLKDLGFKINYHMMPGLPGV
ncbi:tRNA uridine(34) 5-carboxymethylaminomethyl modification radical SAM/GNAT enzyme Elp3, partial [Candidatus Woesearchaeota archaeon]|nr:tRNA uridine(34) 5-carboxymethylaminomethyl modification radical SAM/GNAT enzyme Elp3 [Candidatus Woesearchaeota archaeon]